MSLFIQSSTIIVATIEVYNKKMNVVYHVVGVNHYTNTLKLLKK